ncbi:oligosaccharide repeat unit polymerase, partial [Escherichia coli]
SFLTIFAYIVTFFPLSKIFNKKTFLLFIVVIALVNAPRIIRGGGDLFLASVDDKIKSINVPVNIYTAGPIINYIYYFSSPYSFNQWMEKDFNTTEFTYGSRTFTPFYNILSKLYGNERVVIIDENAYIPFRHNIFSVVKDYYSDFGFWGVILIPFTIGLICGKSIKSFYLTARLSKIDYSYGILG